MSNLDSQCNGVWLGTKRRLAGVHGHLGYLFRPEGQKQPVEAIAFLRSVADMKGSEEEEEEQFIFLYHITDFKTMLILISPESLQVPYSAF